MSKLQHAWKVCRIVNGKLNSAVKWHDLNYCVDYSRPGWIKPPKKGNPFLFVFKTREAARRFKSRRFNLDEYTVLKVATRNLRDKALTPQNDEFDASSRHWPEGTLFTDAVKVIR